MPIPQLKSGAGGGIGRWTKAAELGRSQKGNGQSCANLGIAALPLSHSRVAQIRKIRDTCLAREEAAYGQAAELAEEHYPWMVFFCSFLRVGDTIEELLLTFRGSIGEVFSKELIR